MCVQGLRGNKQEKKKTKWKNTENRMRRKTDQDVYFKRDNSIFLRGSDLLVLGRKIFSFIPSLDSISIRFLDPIIFIQTSLISCLFLLSPFHLLFISFLYQQPRVSSFLSSLSSYLLVLDSHSFCRPIIILSTSLSPMLKGLWSYVI